MTSVRLSRKFLGLMGGICAVVGCAQSAARKDTPRAPARTGGTLAASELRFYDGRPSVNRQGDRISFVSGRSGEDVATWAVEGEGTPRRMVDRDVDSGVRRHVAAEMSPSGEWVLIAATTESGTTLLLRPWGRDAASASIVVGDSVEISAIGEPIVSWNRSGALFAFSRRVTGASPRVWVGATPDSTGATGVNIQELPRGDWTETAPAWVASSGGEDDERLWTVGSRSTETGTTLLYREVASLQEAADASPTVGREDILSYTGGIFPWGANRVLLSRRIGVPGDRVNADKHAIMSQPTVVDPTSDSGLVSWVDSMSLKVVHSSSRGEGLGAFVGLRRAVCQESPRSGSTLFAFREESGVMQVHEFYPARDLKTGSWSLASGPCDDVPVGEDAATLAIDRSLVDVRLAGGGALTELKGVYSTRHFGDVEVFSFAHDGTTLVLRNVSQNAPSL